MCLSPFQSYGIGAVNTFSTVSTYINPLPPSDAVQKQKNIL